MNKKQKKMLIRILDYNSYGDCSAVYNCTGIAKTDFLSGGVSDCGI